MIVRAPRPTSHFSVVRNDLIRDSQLSYRARGVLIAILSHDDNWRTSARQLAKESPDGEHAIRAALRELADLGYLVTERKRSSNGQIRSVTTVFDAPAAAPLPLIENASESAQNGPKRSDPPDPVSPNSVEPAPDKPDPDNRVSIEDLITKNHNERNPWWDALVETMGYEPGNGQRSLWGKFVKMIRNEGDSPEEISIRAKRMVTQWGVKSLTVPSLMEHWRRFGSPIGAATRSDEQRFLESIEREEARVRMAQQEARLRGLPG